MSAAGRGRTRLLAASGTGLDKLYVDDVFSAFTYTGTGAAQTITNGIDLAGKGGMVWLKRRSAADSHTLSDTVRTFGNVLNSETTGGNQDLTSLWAMAVTSNGFSFNTNNSIINLSPATYASWTFRKAAKFFDVVTYTGDGANRTIAHSLGGVPGTIIVKRTDAVSEWKVYHTSIANTEFLALNTTAAKATDATLWNSTTATSSVFSIGTHADVNTNAATYVAYLFAHDTTTDGFIQCGTFTTDAGGNATVNLGWEPQFMIMKQVSAVGNWVTVDSMREWTSNGAQKRLLANTSGAETSAVNYERLTSTGFATLDGSYAAGSVHIYLAIRRPNKPPTVGTQVYNAIARTGTGAVATVTGVGFAPDLALITPNAVATATRSIFDRLRGVGVFLASTSTNADTAVTDELRSFDMAGITFGANNVAADSNVNTRTYINHLFKRAPGFFDEVCYTGTGAARTVAHSLGVAPELLIVKNRVTAGWDFYTYAFALGNAKYLVLNTTAGSNNDAGIWNSTSPSSTVFSVDSSGNAGTNALNSTYVAYLFATLAGISKVFSYTGNGSSQTIACGFTTGARFVLIKRTDAVGDWFVWDTVRGIVAATDPHLSLNTTAAEVTTSDAIDPDVSGFIVNQEAATNINVSAATYIGLAIA